jgi:replicative DNA helicase
MTDRNWIEDDQEPSAPLTNYSEREQELLKTATPFQIKMYGNLDQDTVEAMLVGHLVFDPAADGDKPSTIAADKILEANVSKKMFKNADTAELFDNVLTFYRENRALIGIEDAAVACLNSGQTRNDAAMFRKMVLGCKAAVVARKINVDLLIENLVIRFLQKRQDEIYKKAVEDRNNPGIGPRKSWETMRDACIRDLVDPRGGAIKEYDWMRDYKDNVSWMQDMKENPEKYRGYACGILPIDKNTKGFRNGQLTVFVGAHGGFKTTTMVNVGYGLWERGYNVLYVSLEMEASIMQLMLWCRAAAGQLYRTKAYNGEFTHPDDWGKMDELRQKLAGTDLKDDERQKMTEKLQRLEKVTRGRTPDTADSVIIESIVEREKTRANKFKIINLGQSKKMRLSQLERWLHENSNDFKPDVVIVDYLDLVEPENSNYDRPDIGLGDICKMMRALGKNMGFAVITAAQLKRSAWERLRKNGLDSPEKAQLDTDDIAGSHQIGADADNVFMLWRNPGGNTVQIFTAKARYGEKDTGGGTRLEVDFESSIIGENVEDIKKKTSTKGMGDAWASMAKVNSFSSAIPGQEGLGDDEEIKEGPTLDLQDEEVQTSSEESWVTGNDPLESEL